MKQLQMLTDFSSVSQVQVNCVLLFFSTAKRLRYKKTLSAWE